MGSLMGGWASRVQDPQRASLERNKSLTRDEIEAFKRSTSHHDHDEEGDHHEHHHPYLKSTSEGGSQDAVVVVKEAISTGDWWTRTTWAFLNDPPPGEKDGPYSKYSAQFHVAELAKSK